MHKRESHTQPASKKPSTSFLSKSEEQHFFGDQAKTADPFFNPSFIQPKLEIGAPDDEYEREADRVANAVMRMPDPKMQRQPKVEEEEKLQMKQQIPDIQRMCPHCQERAKQGKPLNCPECEKELQMKPDIQLKGNGKSVTGPAIASQLQTSKGSGSPLPSNTQMELGNKMGADFSGVNIHTDSKATQMNRQLGAKAFTYGNDIYFNKGQYNLESNRGKHLLAHELTHVMQQGVINNQLHKKEFKSTGRANEDTPGIVNKALLNSSYLIKLIGENRLKAALLNSKNFHVIKDYELPGYMEKCRIKNNPSSTGGFFCRVVSDKKYNDLKGDIYVVRYLKLGYVIHELMHKLSGTMVMNLLGSYVNEGITQYFTDRFMEEGQYDILTDHGYQKNLTCAKKIVDKTDEATVANSYFNNDTKLMKDLAKHLRLKNIGELHHYFDKHQCLP